MKYLAAVLAALFIAAILLIASMAGAVTITETGPGVGKIVPLSGTEFQGFDRIRGTSVFGNGKIRALLGENDGRFDPSRGTFIDSQDHGRVIWNLNFKEPVTEFNFALTDAFDQPNHRRLGKSYFWMRIGQAKWEIEKREKNGSVHWLSVAFDNPVSKARVVFRTRPMDGFGVARVTATSAPIPLPPTLLFLGTAFVLLFGVGVAKYAAVPVKRRR